VFIVELTTTTGPVCERHATYEEAIVDPENWTTS